MKLTRLDEGFVVMSDESFTGKRLYASGATTIIHMTIEPGHCIKSHAAPCDMEFFVIEGEGIFTIGEESAKADLGCLVESPREIPHGIENTGPGPLKLLAIKNGA